MVVVYAGLPLRTALNSAFMSVVKLNCREGEGEGDGWWQGKDTYLYVKNVDIHILAEYMYGN